MQVNVRILYGIKVAKTLVPLILEYKNRTDENAEAMMKMLKLTVRINHGNDKLPDFEDSWNKLLANLVN